MNSQPDTYKFEDLPLKDVVRVMRSQADKLAKQEIRITQTMDTAESNYKSMERERLELNGKLVAECDRADALESSNKAQALELMTMTNARNSLLDKEETRIRVAGLKLSTWKFIAFVEFCGSILLAWKYLTS